MRLLMLGGTVFVGRHIVDAAVARGGDVLAAGLTYRPLADTIRDTFASDRVEGAQPTERDIRATPMTPQRESGLLAGVR